MLCFYEHKNLILSYFIIITLEKINIKIWEIHGKIIERKSKVFGIYLLN